jgi:hypothetical protein
MATNRGRMIWCPKPVLKEIDEIKSDAGLDKTADAFKKLAGYSRVGREIENISKLKFIKRR